MNDLMFNHKSRKLAKSFGIEKKQEGECKDILKEGLESFDTISQTAEHIWNCELSIECKLFMILCLGGFMEFKRKTSKFHGKKGKRISRLMEELIEEIDDDYDDDDGDFELED